MLSPLQRVARLVLDVFFYPAPSHSFDSPSTLTTTRQLRAAPFPFHPTADIQFWLGAEGGAGVRLAVFGNRGRWLANVGGLPVAPST